MSPVLKLVVNLLLIDDVMIEGTDSVTFSPGMTTMMCVSFLAVADDLLELPEVVNISVNPSSLITNDNANPSQISITVNDANGKKKQKYFSLCYVTYFVLILFFVSPNSYY